MNLGEIEVNVTQRGCEESNMLAGRCIQKSLSFGGGNHKVEKCICSGDVCNSAPTNWALSHHTYILLAMVTITHPVF